MTQYLSARVILHAVRQLKQSSSKSRVCEFLIGARTLKLSGSPQVGVGTSVPEFVQALNEFTRWTNGDEDTPFFNPFGSQAAYKFKRFPSNGPSVTMHGWGNLPDSPFAIISTTRPKSIERRPVTVAQLRSFLLPSDGASNRPRLIDAAVWFYRTTDLESPSGLPTRSNLEDRFVADVGLTADEVAALFRKEPEDTDADEMPPVPSGPDAPAAEHVTDAVEQAESLAVTGQGRPNDA